MGDGVGRIRAQVRATLAAARGMLTALHAQLRSQYAESAGEIPWLLEHLRSMLTSHADELAEHLRRLGGGSADENGGDSLAVNLIDTAVRKIAPEGAAAALRDYYTALSLLQAGDLMLETNARALGFSSTAALATRHGEEVGAAMARLREALPAAIKGEIELQSRERTA